MREQEDTPWILRRASVPNRHEFSIRRPSRLSTASAQFAFWTTQGRDFKNGRVRSVCGDAYKCDVATIWRPRWVKTRAAGQSKRCSSTDQFDVNTKITAFSAVPGIRHLLAVRRNSGLHFPSGITCQRYDFEGRPLHFDFGATKAEP